MRLHRLILIAALTVLGACSSPSTRPSAPSTAPAADGTQSATSRDGSFQGEVTGKVRPGSRFARLQIGMGMDEVQTLMDRAPDRSHSYESGKRWIPFYFGNDARRLQALYKGEGCLIFTGGNVWGSAGGDLIAIHHDATGACYQP
ncbi:hypothetical protein ACWKW4_20695 [Hydrogenophaga borbori]|uniref:hypothetical protein n=1 Tax=Hydrogenophaga borbori TaxID=2294117 RepID=UPI00301E06DA